MRRAFSCAVGGWVFLLPSLSVYVTITSWRLHSSRVLSESCTPLSALPRCQTSSHYTNLFTEHCWKLTTENTWRPSGLPRTRLIPKGVTASCSCRGMVQYASIPTAPLRIGFRQDLGRLGKWSSVCLSTSTDAFPKTLNEQSLSHPTKTTVNTCGGRLPW